MGDFAFPDRWPIFPRSPWRCAIAAGKVRFICTGPMKHLGRQSYLDATVKLPDGKSYLDHTTDIVAGLIHEFAARV